MTQPNVTDRLEPHQVNWTLVEYDNGNTFLEFFPGRGISIKPSVIFWLDDHGCVYGDDFNYIWTLIQLYDADGFRIGSKLVDGKFQHRLTFAFRDPQHALLFKLSH